MQFTLANRLKAGKSNNMGLTSASTSGKGPCHSETRDCKEAERGREHGRRDTVCERQREAVPLAMSYNNDHFL